MKVVCTQENLKAGLAAVGRIISSSSTLPILNNVLFKTEKGLLKISSTNLEIAVTTQIRCKIETEGSVTVSAKTISDLVNNLPNKNILLQAEGGQMSVEADNYHTSIKTLPAEEFPLIPEVESGLSFSTEAQIFKAAVDQTVFAASSNQTQPEISGVLLKMEKKELRVVATDRYRLAEKRVFFDKEFGSGQEVIVPQKTILEVSRILGNNKGVLEVVVSETQINFSFNYTQVVSRLVDGQYPPYEQIIPTKFTAEILLQRQPFISALRAGGLFSQNTSSVLFDYNKEKQQLTLASESQDLGKSVVDLPAQVEGGSGSLMLNYHYVLDSLSAIESENVVMKITDDSSPAIIVPEGKNDYLYLVMPIKG